MYDFCVILDVRFLCYFWYTISVLFLIHDFCVIFYVRFLCYFWCTISVLSLIHDFSVIFDTQFLCYFWYTISVLFFMYNFSVVFDVLLLYFSDFFFLEEYIYLCLPPLRWGDILFLSCPSQFVSATPLKLLNTISWNLVGSKDTICSCAYYQEILIP
jgi:hypothetical protein